MKGIEVTNGTLNYKITSTLPHRVARLNPSWTIAEPQKIENECFQKAIELTGHEFLDVVNGYMNEWLPARELVLAALNARLSVDSSGEIVVLDQFCPWKDHLLELEKEMQIVGVIKYVLFKDSKGSWRVQCVPVNDNSFTNRLSLPQLWRGLRDDELSKVAGVPGCIFVHATGFIGGNQTFEGCLQMAKNALLAKE